MKDELERIIIDTTNHLHMMNEKELKKRFLKLKTILSKRALEKFADAINKEYLKTDIGVTTQEVKDMMNDALSEHGILGADADNWIDLDIDNLPERFFTRDDIEIETLSIRDRNNETNSFEWVKAKNLRPDMIYGLLNNMKYRYRIQENKEPMRITQEVISKYKLPVREIVGEKANANPHGELLESVFMLDGHEVIID